MSKTLIIVMAVIAVGAGVWALADNKETEPIDSSATVPAASENTTNENIVSEPGSLEDDMVDGTEGTTNEDDENTTPATSSTPSPKTVTVRYTNSGYSPESVNVSVGTTVTFINDSSNPMWTASDAHPSHQDLPSFDPRKGIRKGEQYSYTFEEAGTWDYHNHLRPQDTGSVVVK